VTYSDLQAIYSLLSRYGALLDRLEVEEWLDLFSEDAVLDIGGELLDSRDKRRALTASAPRGLHVANLPVISGDVEAGQVDSMATFLFWNSARQTTRLGWYDDRLVRVGPAWRFASRRISFLDQ
jgi:3-phenylpropionate/cinnamic acid dioxygenase small subunit